MSVISGLNPKRISETGFTLIEVLVALIVITFGLLGLAALQGRALKAESEAYYRIQAMLLLEDMADRLNANRRVASCFAGSAVKYGKGIDETTITCTAGADADAQAGGQIAMRGWHNLILGTTESIKISGTSIGTLPDARGCVYTDGTSNLYYIALSWQGLSETAAPPTPSGADASLTSAITCGKDQYGAEGFRRLVWVPVRIANLD
jgi:type IV pilus assembly protein PilV